MVRIIAIPEKIYFLSPDMSQILMGSHTYIRKRESKNSLSLNEWSYKKNNQIKTYNSKKTLNDQTYTIGLELCITCITKKNETTAKLLIECPCLNYPVLVRSKNRKALNILLDF